jgi:predicted AlkP superfamily phosphohydrolase/phosphomutase
MGEVEGIRINLKGKYPQGIVSEKEYKDLREKIINKARKLRDPKTGSNVFKNVFRREELFKGDCTKKFPDIILKPNDQYYLTPKFFRRNEKKPGIYLANDMHWRKISGSHRQYGIFIMTGPDIKPGNQINDIDIMDIFPTVFYLMEAPISDDVDGKVLYKCFNENFVKSRKARFKKLDKKAMRDGSDIYSKEEEEELIKSLKGLGYIG